MSSRTGELHHGDHRHLLDEAPPVTRPIEPDAIVVPTFRGVDALRDSMLLAGKIGCPLIVICSGRASARHAAALGEAMGADVAALDLADVGPAMAEATREIPRFRTDRLLSSNGHAHASDLSAKRNLGLLLSRAAGWERVLFLDDDIHRVDQDGLRDAAGALDNDRLVAVGLRNEGFPDNSVVCHANREIGEDQSTFIGGGAMVVRTGRTGSFFPNIYNEDWFFLLGDGVPFTAGVAGVMRQRTYDPFANPARAEIEEVGDTLAEGLYWLLDYGRGLHHAGEGFWGAFQSRRWRWFDHMLARIDQMVANRTRAAAITASITAARRRSCSVQPGFYEEFVRRWQDDLHVWREHLTGIPVGATLDEGLATLGLSQVVRRPWSSHPDIEPTGELAALI